MLKENLIMLRNMNGYSQEEIAEKIDISRQAYAKWELGTTVPDIEKCRRLADVYGITIDKLVNNESSEKNGFAPIADKGKNIWGSVTMGERGQVIIPKGAREKFGLGGGSRIIVLSDDEEGIALIPAEKFEAKLQSILKMSSEPN